MVALAAAAGWGQAVEDLPNQILLGAGYGQIISLATGFEPATVSQALTLGIHQDLVRRISIEELVRERFLVQFDYDGEREGGLLGSDNTYALTYTGAAGEILREITLGNKDRSIAGSRYLPMDGGSGDSYALRVQAGSPEATEGPRLDAEALVRYGASAQRTKRFHGARQLVETRILDVAYVARRGFLLPDQGIDEASLRVLRSAPDVGSFVIEGKRYALLERDADFRLDNAAGTIYMTRALGRAEELAVTYERAGTPVGTPPLGAQAIVTPAGTRADFSQAAFPEYFGSDGERPYLFLRRDGLSSYWELKNAYALEGVAGSSDPGPITVGMVFTLTGLENPSYRDVLSRHRVDPTLGAVVFEPVDAHGFYPRPFPGERPFTDPDAPVNPFAPDNPIYGGPGDPDPSASVNTLVVRYAPQSDEFFLDYDVIEDSVHVRVDGLELTRTQFAMDYPSGVITFGSGVVSPSSDVAVSYSVATGPAEAQELVVATGLGLAADPVAARSFSTLRLPLPTPEAPRVGEERGGTFAAGVDASLALGARDGERGPAVELSSGAALSVGTGNSHGVAIVADMETGSSTSLSTLEERWIPGSRSTLLALAPTPVSLANRGPLRYRDYWKSSAMEGETLEPVSWDDSANPAFPYAEKAGPYNSADVAPGRVDRSLVLELDLEPTGTGEPYVAVATPLGGQNLSAFELLHLAIRSYELSGASVRVYVELLRAYQEDLNGNDALDGESSVLQPGLPITPVDGSSTVIGTDRHGQADGRITTEDLNQNGVLDPVGAYALDTEEGILLGGDGGWITELPPGDEEWRTVTVDLRTLARTQARVFQEPQVLRITVTAPAVGEPVTGRLLVGGIWLSTAPLRNQASEYLQIEEVSTSADSRVAADPLSLAYPEIYAALHGSAASRARRGQDESTLVARLTDPLPDGAMAEVSEIFATPRSFTPYGIFRAYVRMDSWPPPPELVLRVTIESTPVDLLATEIPAEALRQGWNEISIGLKEPRELRVNGEPRVAVDVTGDGRSLGAVRAVRFAVVARGGDLPAGLELWLDEWHLAEPGLALDTALYGEAAAGYRGSLLATPSGWGLVADVFFRGGYERRQGALAETPDLVSSTWWLSHESWLLGALKPRFRASGSRTTPAGGSALVKEGSGTTWSYGLGVDTGLAWLPVLDHAYHRTIAEGQELGLGETGYVDVDTVRASQSLTLEDRFNPTPALSQSYLFSRTWDYTRRQSPGVEESLLFKQVHDAKLQIIDGGRRVAAGFATEAGWTSGAPVFEADALAAYLATMAAAFAPSSQAIPSAAPSARSDRAALDLSLPRSRYLGLQAKSAASFLERNFDAAAEARDTELSGSLAATFPVSPDGKGDVQVSLAMAHTLAASASNLPIPLTELHILGTAYPLLLRPPFYYLGLFADYGRINELRAVGLLADDPELAPRSSVTLTTSTGLGLELRKVPWFLPSRLGLSLEGVTTRSGLTYGQTRALVGTIGTSLTASRPDAPTPLTVALDGTYRYGRGYTNKVITHGVSASVGLGLPVGRYGGLRLDHTLAYTFERQHPEDPILVLWPGGDLEEPAVAVRPDKSTVKNSAALELWSDRPAEGKRSQLIFTRLPTGRERLELTERLEVQSILVFTDPEKVPPYTAVPLNLIYTQSVVFRQSEYLALSLRIRMVAGAEDLISATDATRVPAVGFEFATGVELRF